MNTATPTDGLPARGDMETLSLALLLALALHALVITQLHFDWMRPGREEPAPNLDVILVDSASENAPDEADFLAQANQVGGGEGEEPERPSAPPAELPAETGREQIDEPEAPEPVRENREQRIIAAASTQPQPPEPEPDPTDTEPLPDPAELLRQVQTLVQSAPDPLAREQVLPRRPRRKFITANTREHLYAAYMRSWVAKVERVGNMNYPEQARRRNLEGSLVLSVDVLPDGSIERVQVLRSSGYELLDDAAVRIVRLSAPFSELPPDILSETDILTITRTWQFSAQRGLN
ncbi:MAG: energy transducer TonB [Wenzhouxiangellaceae bacterium]